VIYEKDPDKLVEACLRARGHRWSALSPFHPERLASSPGNRYRSGKFPVYRLPAQGSQQDYPELFALSKASALFQKHAFASLAGISDAIRADL